MLRPDTVAPSVQVFPARTPTLLPATHTNSYALGAREVVLVEPATPYEDEQREWLAWARGLASQGRELLALFLTHHHGDHAGGTGVLARELHLPVWAHRLTAERLPGVAISRHLADGEGLILRGPADQRWDVLHTPGHAPGHLCLHEADLGLLVAGDMVATSGTILIEPGDGDMTAYLAQLERLQALGTRRTLPAHGAPIDDPAALFTRYLLHRRMREQKVLVALRGAGPAGATLSELVRVAYDDTPPAVWPLAELSFAAHLQKLERDGLARTDGERHLAVGAGPGEPS